MESFILVSFGILLTATISLCLWVLVVCAVLMLMRFNAWAHGVERNIRLSRGRTY